MRNANNQSKLLFRARAAQNRKKRRTGVATLPSVGFFVSK
jgi:hypothetical protein